MDYSFILHAHNTGSSPANMCTGNAWWGCERVGNPTNYVNPIQSARVRTVNSFSFTYGKVDITAKMPTGDWLWPGKIMDRIWFTQSVTMGRRVVCIMLVKVFH